MDIFQCEPQTNRHSKMYTPEATVKLVKSVSDQNVFLTYVCTVNSIKPEPFEKDYKRPSSDYLDGDVEEIDDDDPPIQVERSKALHELVESHKSDKVDRNPDEKDRNETCSSTPYTATSADESDYSENEYILDRNPNILKLTKMKWLTEDQPGSPDSSCNITPALSSTSTSCSRESDEYLSKSFSSDKYLSTILRLDKEHNLFGLSNIAIVGSRPSRKIKNQDERAVFHQTAIVQVCCGNGCCRHTSKTDLPASLKCSSCRSCCGPPSCAFPCPLPHSPPPACPPCPSPRCAECTSGFGLKISVSRKLKYEPTPIEITPRSSCILQKPLAARPCQHWPPCAPPSSCFPYLMPCFWPSRAGAPCNTPARCFHNPPCRPPRRPSRSEPKGMVCPPKCSEDKENKKCINKSCLGMNPEMKKELENKYGAKAVKEKKHSSTDKSSPAEGKRSSTERKTSSTDTKHGSADKKPNTPEKKPSATDKKASKDKIHK